MAMTVTVIVVVMAKVMERATMEMVVALMAELMERPDDW